MKNKMVALLLGCLGSVIIVFISILLFGIYSFNNLEVAILAYLIAIFVMI
jgi:hypothetical protein